MPLIADSTSKIKFNTFVQIEPSQPDLEYGEFALAFKINGLFESMRSMTLTLYPSHNNIEIMNKINIKKNVVGEKGKMLTENLEVTINFYDETALSVNLPNQIKSKIETTDAALKKQTVSSSYKPATLDNGLSIQVPPFIEIGDEIIVDTRTIEYVKKV